MPVSQARQESSNGTSTTHSSRRRRRGQPAATPAARQPTTLLQHGPIVRGGRTPPPQATATTTPTTTTTSGGRGGGRRTIWEGNTASATPPPPPAPPPGGRPPNNTSAATAAGSPAAAVTADKVSKAGGGGGRARGGVAPASGKNLGAAARKVHPGMLESEFLAATGQANAGGEGGGAVSASLSLEEVPYDRDLRWCNTASDNRPRPRMDASGGVFGKVGPAIAQDTGDYERLDRHYQELWKDREGNGPPPGGRGGGGGRASRGGGRGNGGGGGGGRARGGGRGPSGGGGRTGPNGARGGFATATGRNGRGGDATIPGRREGNVGPPPRGGRGGRGGAGSPSFSREAVGAAAPEVTRGSGSAERGAGAGHRKRGQRANGVNKALGGRGGGGGGMHPGGRSNVAPQSGPSSGGRLAQRSVSTPSYLAQGASAAAVAHEARGGLGGSGPVRPQSLNNVRGWSEGKEQQQQQQQQQQHSGSYQRGQGQDPWAMDASSGFLPHRSLSPPGPGMAVSAGSVAISGGGGGGGPGMGTPSMVPAMPSLLAQRFPPDSPDTYLGDLANALNSTPPPPSPYAGHQQQQPSAVTPPLGPSLLNGGDGSGAREPRGEGFTPDRNGNGSSMSLYLSPPRQSKILADPSLDVDIQDICADPDLNADAPAFVPGGY